MVTRLARNGMDGVFEMKLVTTKNLQDYRIPLGRNITTGKIHLVSGGSSWCGQSRKNSLISLGHANRAPESMYCEKCFAGKPSEFVEYDPNQPKAAPETKDEWEPVADEVWQAEDDAKLKAARSKNRGVSFVKKTAA